MLLTIPILYAFYNLLSSSIELRGAPFLGWIHDLSLRDPFYITPVLMGATMLLQQRMMPSTADPVQQKMFMLMPVVFTTMFLWAPSGLVIYWLMSNLMAIGQQYVTNRLIGGPPPTLSRAKAS
jgi:YidC/Oxa1 family membrane protein insertase